MSSFGRREVKRQPTMRLANAGVRRLHRPSRLPTLMATTSVAIRARNLFVLIVGL